MNWTYFWMGTIVLSLAVLGRAHAGETIQQSGHETFTTDVWEKLQLSEGHATALWRGKGVAYADESGSPLHLATADCVGSFEFMPGGTSKGAGFCTYTTSDGDKLFLRWRDNPGKAKSRYEWIGGTGQLAGASGGGTYTLKQLPNGLSTGQYEGVLKLP